MSRTKHHGWKAKKREFGNGWRWTSQTPGWFVRTFMTRPQRRAVKLWERDAVKTTDIDRVDKPPHGHKPHVYYW